MDGMRLSLSIANKIGKISKRSMKGFFISIILILLFYIPINYYYSHLVYTHTVLPNFSWTNYNLFYPTIIQNDKYLLMYDIIHDNEYPQWSNITGFELNPIVYADNCFTYSYDNFNKSHLTIKSESNSRLVINRNGEITELNGTQFSLNISQGDKIYFYTNKECIPYITISDDSKTYFIKLT